MKIQWYCENIHAISGYSDEARVMVKGLADLGIEVKIIGKNIKPGRNEFKFQDRIEPGIPVVYHTYRHGNYRLRTHSYGIVRSMLEVTRIPQNWVYRFNQLSEIWVPNVFNYKVFERSGVKKDRIFIIPSPIDSGFGSDDTVFQFKTRKKFVFLSLFNYSARIRKGLDILLRAYTKTFNQHDDVCLVIKSNTSRDTLDEEFNLSGSIPEIEVVNCVLDKKELGALFRAAHCFIMPSRGEGIGRPYLEAMKAGLPIIATGWGGHCEFLSDNNSFLIQYKLVDVDRDDYIRYPGFYGSRWAEPDLEDLKKNMLQVYNDYGYALKKSNRARQQVETFRIEKISRLMIERFENPLPARVYPEKKPNLFERLLPLYYPDLKFRDDVLRFNQQAFQSHIESVAIFGIGQRARHIFHYVNQEAGIKNILFVDDQVAVDTFLNCPLVDINRFSAKKDPVDLIIIGAKLNQLGDIFNRLICQIDTLPVYVFD
ncbi:MAG: glycosyltransferase family 4 protein [Candidatus Aminicenantes bacterium]|nr:glycosyltransferase family 4 protein [Candidatus Aminicenantes bacterium]